ncbi:hypothetical protein E2I00_000440, partial [Balaenoptera physalus]
PRGLVAHQGSRLLVPVRPSVLLGPPAGRGHRVLRPVHPFLGLEQSGGWLCTGSPETALLLQVYQAQEVQVAVASVNRGQVARQQTAAGKVRAADGRSNESTLPAACPAAGCPRLGAPSPGRVAQGLVEVADALPAELYYDRGNHHEFVSLVKDLARPGEVTQSQAFDFEFTHVEKPYESYTGQNVKLRRRLNDVVKEMDIVVHTLSTYPELNSSIKMEVGIEDCLHIEFEYNKSKYHLKDVIVGKIYFLLVRIKIKHMEIDIIKRETTGTGPNVYHENDTIAKYEIMDGAPVRGELRPHGLGPAPLTPTMRDINKKFSVRYYLNLVLIDEEERRYFKQ